MNSQNNQISISLPSPWRGGGGEAKVKVCGMREAQNIEAVAELGIDMMGFIFYEKSPRCVREPVARSPKEEGIERVGVFVNADIQDILDKAVAFDLDCIQLHGSESADYCRQLRKVWKGKIFKAISVKEAEDVEKAKEYVIKEERGERREEREPKVGGRRESQQQDNLLTSSLTKNVSEQESRSLSSILFDSVDSRLHSAEPNKFSSALAGTRIPLSSIIDLFLFDTKCKTMGGSGEQFDWSVLDHYDGDIPFLLSGGIGPDDVERVKAFRHPKCIGVDLNSRFETAPALKDAALLKRFIRGLTPNPSPRRGE